MADFKKILFTDVMPYLLLNHEPIPANKELPEWYKDTPSYINGKKIVNRIIPGMTVKRCIPFFDAMAAGYYLKTHSDIKIDKQISQNNAIGFHDIKEAEKHPISNGFNYLKFINRWAIETPKGYSCLFINPMHNGSGIFKILEGIVDTDNYTYPVNIPFVLTDPLWEGIIPAGTIFAQVIPFKRDSFEMEFGKHKELSKINHIYIKLVSSISNAYRNFWRSEKVYK